MIAALFGRLSEAGFVGDQLIEARRNLFAEMRHPKRRDDSCENVHGVVRAQDQHRCDLENDNQYGKNRKLIPLQAG